MRSSVFVTEETPVYSIDTDKTVFVIDPTDGTMNFVKNFRHSRQTITQCGLISELMQMVHKGQINDGFTLSAITLLSQ